MMEEHHEEPSSRICVKNVPKYVTEKRLKEHFAAKGVVTDVKILKTRWVAALGTRRHGAAALAPGRARAAAAAAARCAAMRPPRCLSGRWAPSSEPTRPLKPFVRPAPPHAPPLSQRSPLCVPNLAPQGRPVAADGVCWVQDGGGRAGGHKIL